MLAGGVAVGWQKVASRRNSRPGWFGELDKHRHRSDEGCLSRSTQHPRDVQFMHSGQPALSRLPARCEIGWDILVHQRWPLEAFGDSPGLLGMFLQVQQQKADEVRENGLARSLEVDDLCGMTTTSGGWRSARCSEVPDCSGRRLRATHGAADFDGTMEPGRAHLGLVDISYWSFRRAAASPDRVIAVLGGCACAKGTVACRRATPSGMRLRIWGVRAVLAAERTVGYPIVEVLKWKTCGRRIGAPSREADIARLIPVRRAVTWDVRRLGASELAAVGVGHRASGCTATQTILRLPGMSWAGRLDASCWAIHATSRSA